MSWTWPAIRAPYNAVTDRQKVEPGQFISLGQIVAHLLSSDTAEVTLPVSAAESGFLDASIEGNVELSA